MDLHRGGRSLIRRWVLILMLFSVATTGQTNSNARVFDARVFNAPVEATWSAAVEAATDGFVAERIIKSERRLRLRAGPLRDYAFDVVLSDVDGRKARVELVLRTNSAIPAVRKDAQR